jgi:macrolide-specific efflux system membrane fusion protein
MSHRRDKPTNRWYLYVLGLLALGVIALAVLEIGPPSSSARTATEVVDAQDGVVQSTVSGTGNVAPGTDVTINFNTSGTLQNVDVKVGQYVKQGQLIATLNPTSAQLTLDQAEESLTAAEDTLTETEDGESTTGTTSSSGSGSSSTASTTITPSASSIASAQASVYSAEATLSSAQTALNNTKLYAPTSGTISSLSSLTPGQEVSSGSGSGTSSSSSSSNSGSGSTGTTSAGSLGGSSSSSSSSGSSSSSSSGFAEIINTKTMTMTVALSESDISSVKLNQPATVSMDALSGVQLAAKVTQISPVGTSSDGVVSFDATLTLTQGNPQVKPGMSASASIVTDQSQGVTVPNQAVTGNGSVGSVQIMRNGKTVSQPVIVGLRGSSRSVIETGLTSGEPVVLTITLPSLSSTPASTTSGTGTLGGGGLGGGGFGGLAGLGGGGFRGGGGAFRGAGGG